MIGEREELVLHCASHLWTDMVSKLSRDMQRVVLADDEKLLLLADGWCKAIRAGFEDIKSGRHKCSSPCLMEYLFQRVDPSSPGYVVVLERPITVAVQMLSQMPREWLDEDLGDDAARRAAIADRIMKSYIILT